MPPYPNPPNPDLVQTPTGFSMLPSPYFFVPMDDRVWVPDGSPPSHDEPVQGGLSGHLQLTATAQTPIFIRGAGRHPKDFNQKRKDEKYQSFYTLPDNIHAIPATSLGGMLRSLFEIITFSKLQPVTDRRYAVRDLKTKDDYLYKKWLTITTRAPDEHGKMTLGFKPTARAAWLHVETDGSWSLEPCEFARVEQTDLEDWAWKENGIKINLGISLVDKYAEWKRTKLDLKSSLPVDDEKAHEHSKVNLIYSWVNPNGTQKKDGILVFTGQPQNREKFDKQTEEMRSVSGNKHMEFFFHSATNKRIKVTPGKKDDFLFTHCDEKGDPEGEWKQRGKHFKAGSPIPVFYLTTPANLKEHPLVFPPLNDDGSNLHAFGLALMFRLPYRHSMDEGRSDAHRFPKGLDAAERVFGYVRDQEALRKRVTPGVLRCTTPHPSVLLNEEGLAFRTVASSPRPTFYPHYVRQPKAKRGKNNEISYSHPMKDDFRLAGWKRYAVRPKPPLVEIQSIARPFRAETGASAATSAPLPPPNSRSGDKIPVVHPKPNERGITKEDMCSWFRPLDSGTSFSGKIHFHNLHPWELGALLWAITWGGQGKDSKLCHSLGFGKGIGLGAVRLVIEGDRSEILPHGQPPVPFSEEKQKEWFSAFEEKLQTANFLESGQSLADLPHIKELLALANPDNGAKAAEKDILRYPKEPKNFGDAKKDGYCLPNYTELFAPSDEQPTCPSPPAAKPKPTAGSPASSRTTPAPTRPAASPLTKAAPLPPPPPKAIPLVTIRLTGTNPKGRFKGRQEASPKDSDTGVVTAQPEGAQPTIGQLWRAELLSPAPKNQNYRLIELLPNTP